MGNSEISSENVLTRSLGVEVARLINDASRRRQASLPKNETKPLSDEEQITLSQIIHRYDTFGTREYAR